MRTFDDLVRAGKIRYAGLSDVPGWYAARAQAWAEAHALTQPICLQLPYSLVERSIEHEFVPFAEAIGLGITAWSPLAMGLLSGKYRASAAEAGRLSQDTSGGGLGLFTERNTRILAVLERIAGEMGRSMAQIALNWCVNRPGVSSAIVGASRLSQLDDNLAALDFTIPSEFRSELDSATVLDAPYPYALFADDYQAAILNTGVCVGDKPPSYRREILLPMVSDYAFGQPKNKDHD
jgi:aryl-alcohol dehydrogenase-like predicted oxidoreductase